jgi:hypothetical protein
LETRKEGEQEFTSENMLSASGFFSMGYLTQWIGDDNWRTVSSTNVI